jgi:flagellar assembly protein FliH
MNSSKSKGFTREELAALSPWRLPVMDEEEPEPEEALPEEELDQEEPPPRMPTAEEIEAIQKQAHEEAAAAGYQEGHQRGHQEGLEQGRREGLAQGREQGWQEGHDAGEKAMLEAAARFQPLADCLAAPLALVDEQVEQELVALAIAIAKQLIRRELRTDPGQIVAVARDALKILPSSSRRVSLHLHPDDVELVRNALALKDAGPRWKIVEDPLMTRGGCRVMSETSQIDATLEKRLMAVIAHLLGGGREGDSP